MTTVAEGIETSFQKDFLQEINCDMLQGYVFSRPLPIKTLKNLCFKTPPINNIKLLIISDIIVSTNKGIVSKLIFLIKFLF
ncbi:EAL domain-containing protein [Clostridioides difficile]|nr:EAL domain-containing protein [Clostridioides difficile]